MGSCTTWPSARWKVSYLWSTACTEYVPAGTSFKDSTGKPRTSAPITALAPAFKPATSIPKICCVLSPVPVIWKRGSALSSLEITTSTRPSNGPGPLSAG